MDTPEYEQARQVLLSMMPSASDYDFVSSDMVAGLIKRDFKVFYY
jgi:hypothetical protein